MDRKALAFFFKLKPYEIARYGANIIFPSSKDTHFLKNLESVAQKLRLPCPFQFQAIKGHGRLLRYAAAHPPNFLKWFIFYI